MKVLLVDDNEDTRYLMAESLSSHGYQVLEAASGMEAIRACLETAEPPDVLLTDIQMPGMTGFQLADHLKANYSNLRVLYMSAGGYSTPVLPKDWVIKELITNPNGARLLLAGVVSVFGQGTEHLAGHVQKEHAPLQPNHWLEDGSLHRVD